MDTRTVRITEQRDGRRWRVLVPRRDVRIVAVGFAIGFWLTACAPLSRLRPFDPEKDFAYSMLEHREPGDAMVVTRATLESHGQENHALVLDATVEDTVVVCVDLPATSVRDKPREACVTVAAVRKMIEAANATPK